MRTCVHKTRDWTIPMKIRSPKTRTCALKMKICAPKTKICVLKTMKKDNCIPRSMISARVTRIYVRDSTIAAPRVSVAQLRSRVCPLLSCAPALWTRTCAGVSSAAAGSVGERRAGRWQTTFSCRSRRSASSRVWRWTPQWRPAALRSPGD